MTSKIHPPIWCRCLDLVSVCLGLSVLFKVVEGANKWHFSNYSHSYTVPVIIRTFTIVELIAVTNTIKLILSHFLRHKSTK